MSYWDVMNMPNSMFWLLNRNLDRYASEADLRSLNVAQAATSGEASEALRKRLEISIGRPVVEEEVLDRTGLNKLRNLGGA